MNEADFAFLQKFPNGLEDDLWLSMGKKHNPDRITKALNEEFSKQKLKEQLQKKDYKTICETALKLLRRATVVSVFEKVAFTNYLAHEEVHEDFSKALYNLYYKFSEESFKEFVLVLARYRKEKNSNACKWTVVTFFLAFKEPDKYVFVKPTTTKAIAVALKTDIDYSPYPTYSTYMKISDMIHNFRESSDIFKNESLMLAEAGLYSAVKL